MGVLDEDGRPVRGAGALPYAGASGGTGDMSGVSFSRNILERPADPNKLGKGKFMADFQKLISDIAAGHAPPDAEPTPTEEISGITETSEVEKVYPPGSTPEKREIYGGAGESPEEREQRRAQTEIELKREDARRRMQKARDARKAKAEARRDGTLAMPEPEVRSKGKRRTSRTSAKVRGRDEGRSVSEVRVPDLPRTGSDSGAGVPKTGANGTVASENHSELTASALPHIDPQLFATMPLESAEHLLNELRAQLAAIGEMIQSRRQDEASERTDVCLWCKEPFPGGVFFARFPFELEPGSGQWRSINSCRKGECLAKFNRASEEIQRQLKLERAR